MRAVQILIYISTIDRIKILLVFLLVSKCVITYILSGKIPKKNSRKDAWSQQNNI